MGLLTRLQENIQLHHRHLTDAEREEARSLADLGLIEIIQGPLSEESIYLITEVGEQVKEVYVQ